MPAAILVTHGRLGRILMDCVEATLGAQSDVFVVSAEGASLEQIIARVGEIATGGPAAVFVDFCGGSPYIACRTLQQTAPDYVILSGVNLPMLLSFFTKRDRLPFAELVEVVEADAHRGIRLSTHEPSADLEKK
ncbi:MAG: hypothetical protein PHI18_07880 [bacterium]|nr:hypothetical protein [bacterium]